jgi:TonB family protein
MRRLATLTCAIVLASAAAAFAQTDLEPARFSDGTLPGMPPLAVAGGQVMLSVGVTPTGAVSTIEVLRSTPPYTESLIQAVKSWRFSPALDAKRMPMTTRVLIGAVITAPSLTAPTLGTPPKDITTDDGRIPFPAQTKMPTYPITANAGGTVVVETRVDSGGRVVAVTAVRSQPPFDTPALDTARSWTFRPAQSPVAPPSQYAYLVFVFRAPLTGSVLAPGPAASVK